MDAVSSTAGTTDGDLLEQRVSARAKLSVARLDGRTRLRRLYQDGAAKIRMPRPEGDWLEAVLINTAGGLTGGDRLAWDVEMGPDAAAVVTTQASEKVYRAACGHAELAARLVVGANARLAWLPQETILFDRAAFRRTLDVDLAEGATLLVAEATIFGRRSMGERVTQGVFRDRWRIRSAGRLVHAEDFSLACDVDALLGKAPIAGGATAVATILLVCDDPEGWLERVRAIVGREGGASAWRVGPCGKLLARLYAEDGYMLRKRLVPLVGMLNGQAGLPKAWSL